MKVILMGTPPFAVPSLDRLIKSNNHQVVSVFTQQPKAKDRGLKETKSPVHVLADSNNIPVYTPENLKNIAVVDLIASISADIIVVVAYGFIIPKIVLTLKHYGCLNIHPSSLPKYRGAAPLQRTIINGEHTTAVCIMQMNEGLDTGDIILKENISVAPNITLNSLHDQCASLGAELLIKALDNIDFLLPYPQSEQGISYAHKLTKEEAKVKWHESAYQINCKVRGMNPWPGVYFEYNNKVIKILEANYLDTQHNSIIGQVLDDQLTIACGKGILMITKLQQSNKKAMHTEDFLRGTPIPKGAKLQ
ncbi:MAG: methionyl-tRNA formyltransferase [Rickettsiaceae bacterium]|nr:MAG: methionyl-tRNA formyltransferase [Rickettsiaceae bacterium]